MNPTLYAIIMIILLSLAPTAFFFVLLKSLDILRDDALISSLDGEYSQVTFSQIGSSIKNADSINDIVNPTDSNTIDNQNEWKY